MSKWLSPAAASSCVVTVLEIVAEASATASAVFTVKNKVQPVRLNASPSVSSTATSIRAVSPRVKVMSASW